MWVQALRALAILMIVPYNVSISAHAEQKAATQDRLKQFTERLLLDKVESEVDRLLARKQSYQALKAHKALAACVSDSHYVSIWNSNHDNDSLADAKEAALAACMGRKESGCTCHLVYADDLEVLQLPDAAISSELKRRLEHLREPKTEQLPFFEPSSQAISALDGILSASTRVEQPNGIEIRFPLKPAQPTSPASTECNFLYACSCSRRFSFGFTRILASDPRIHALRERSEAGYTKCFEQTTGLLGETLTFPKHMCRYVTTASRNGSYLAPTSVPDLKFLSDFGYRQIDQLWLEAIIPVDKNRLPIAPPLKFATPLLVESLGEFFSVSISFDDESIGCALSATYSNLIFSGANCANPDLCLNTAIDAYIGRLGEKLAAKPILATRYTASPRPPGEYWFRREKQTSEVLGGSPMRENSTYVIKWWRPTLLLGGRASQDEDQGKASGFEKYIYLDITAEVLTAVGNDKFHDATDDELPKFQAVVRAAGWEALKASCADVMGSIEGDTCRLN